MTSKKNTYSYYKKLWRANKTYNDKIGNRDYAMMLNKDEFNAMQSSGLTANEIAYNQFHFYSKDMAKKIQASLKQEGFKVSMKNIQTKNYAPEIYNKIQDLYHQFRESGMNSKEASALISYTYYGS